jgi:hypothetical protein
LSAISPDEFAPSSPATFPDPIPAHAWRAIDLLPGEMPFRSWRTGDGYLLLTNLRCVSLSHVGPLFSPHLWHSAPEFFLYNLRAPRVLLGRFVELSEEYPENGWTGRFRVRDPATVVAEIAAAIEPGRLAWLQRREHAEELLRAQQRMRSERAAGGPRSPVMVRCSYCGNLADASRRQCPSCGAVLG